MRDIKKIAILNRGEAALRFIRSLREYNLENNTSIASVALYTDPERDAPFCYEADEAISIGPPLKRDSEGRELHSYCDIPYILKILQHHRCDALWPGWGFLSEDADFVEELEKAGIVFLGPPSEAMRALGDKVSARELAEKNGVPLAPWVKLSIYTSEEKIERAARELGFPLMVKFSAGGGGRGIKKVSNRRELFRAIGELQNVSKAFGEGEIFLEKFIQNGRHIEIQGIVNSQGKAFTLGVRDCTVQRRHQKMIEETPSPVVGPELSAELSRAAERLLSAAGYRGVATVEFIYDPAERRAYFLEVNARLQVEHTVTEEVWGCDLVKAQIDIARGVHWAPPSEKPRGWAIQARLNAEDPARNFAPSPGKVQIFRIPTGPGIRVDSGIREGQTIAPEFDSMIAKIIAWGQNREQARARLIRALRELQIVIEDGATNKSALLNILQHPDFIHNRTNTNWVESSLMAENLTPSGIFQAVESIQQAPAGGATGTAETTPPSAPPEQTDSSAGSTSHQDTASPTTAGTSESTGGLSGGQSLHSALRSFEMMNKAIAAAAILEYRRYLSGEIHRFFSQVHNGIPQNFPRPEGKTFALSIAQRQYSVTVYSVDKELYYLGDGKHLYPAKLRFIDHHTARFTLGEKTHQIVFGFGSLGVTIEIDGLPYTVERITGGQILSPLPGVIVDIAVREGQWVEKGALLCIVEAMKMETPIYASDSGKIKTILCKLHQQVETGQLLIQFQPAGQSSSALNQTLDLPVEPVTLPELPRDSDFSSETAALKEYLQSSGEAWKRHALQLIRSQLLGYDTPQKLSSHLLNLLSAAEKEKVLLLDRSILTEFLDTFSSIEMAQEKRLLFSEDSGETIIPEDEFFEFCRRHWEGEEAIHPRVRELMLRALKWYGISSLESSSELREALWRMARGHRQREETFRLISALLRQLIAGEDAEVPPLISKGWSPDLWQKYRSSGEGEGDSLYSILNYIERLALPEYPAVADNTRQAIYTLFHRQRILKEREETERRLRRLIKFWATRAVPSESASETRPNEGEKSLGRFSPYQLIPFLLRELPPNHPAVSRSLTESMRQIYRLPELSAVSEPMTGDALFGRVFQLGRRRYASAVWCDSRNWAELFERLPLFLSDRSENLEILEIWLYSPVDAGGESQIIDKFEDYLNRILSRSPVQRVTLNWLDSDDRLRHNTYFFEGERYRERVLWRDLHPAAAERLKLYRLEEFQLERLPSPEQIYAFKARAKKNPKDERIFVFTEIFNIPRRLPSEISDPRNGELGELSPLFFESVRIIREEQAKRSSRKRYLWNRLTFHISVPSQFDAETISRLAIRFEPATRGLSLERVSIIAPIPDGQGLTWREFSVIRPGRHRLEVRVGEPEEAPIPALTPYQQRVLRARRRGYVYPYEIIKMLLGEGESGISPHPEMGRGKFTEYDLDESGRLVPVDRPFGENKAAVVVGKIVNYTSRFPEGMARVWIASDPTKAMGALAEPECRRIIGALELARREGLPVEWLPISAGAKISMDSGTENLDWTARVLREIVQFTQDGGTINIIVDGVNVGAQSYWNAEATMLMHTKGILIMTPKGSMVLTGKKALAYSGGVSASDEVEIGGYARIMGPNGQAQFFAEDLGEAYKILFDYYEISYRPPGEQIPRRRKTSDPLERSICDEPYRSISDEPFIRVGEIFDPEINPDRKKPFAIRQVMAALKDKDAFYLERFGGMRYAEMAVVWETFLGGWPVSLIGIESRPFPRKGRIPLDGPEIWNGGTLYPQSSKKIARALNSASGNRPAVILANLSGFDGSPESLRKLQLEFGAEIGRAVVNFKGPVIFAVIGRYHGGAYVVFSKSLNPNLKAIALEGSFASVIGGAPAAAVVFPHEVKRRTEADPRILQMREKLEKAPPSEKPVIREEFEALYSQVYLEKQGEVAAEFDSIHTVERAFKVGSLDEIIPPSQLRPRIIQLIDSFYRLAKGAV